MEMEYSCAGEDDPVVKEVGQLCIQHSAGAYDCNHFFLISRWMCFFLN